MKDRPLFTIQLVPTPGPWRTPPIVRLRHALKSFLRAYGLRCLSARETTETKHKEKTER